MTQTTSEFPDLLLDIVRSLNVQDFSGEVALNRELNTRLGGSGRPYPKGTYPGLCDIVVPTSAGKSRWIEVKYAQTYFSQQQFLRDNNALFEKYVFSTSPREHTVRNDFVRKLSTLIGHPVVSHIGMLVIFLYSDRFPLPEDLFPRLRSAANLDLWAEFSLQPWRNPNHLEVPSYVYPVYWDRCVLESSDDRRIAPVAVKGKNGLPDFDEHGYLPPGIHPASIDEVIARFGQGSDTRIAQAQSLAWLVPLCRAAGIARVILNGSFVTDVREPNDVDCILLQGSTYRADSPAAAELKAGLPFLELKVVQEEDFEFYASVFFATDRDMVPKGVVEVVL